MVELVVILDYWSYKSCKAPVKSSPPTNQHPVLYRPDALPVAQPTVSKHWREKYHIPWTCLPQTHLGGLPNLSLTTNSSWLPWGRVATPLISPLMPVPHNCYNCSKNEKKILPIYQSQSTTLARNSEKPRLWSQFRTEVHTTYTLSAFV